MGYYCINRSGKTLNVTKTNAGGAVLGTIAPNEIFMYVSGWNGNDVEGGDSHIIRFKKTNTTYETGWLNGATHLHGLVPLTECCLYKLDIGLGHGIESIFQTKRAVNRYNSNGKYVDSLPANSFVVTKNGTCGEKNFRYMSISAYGIDGGDPKPFNGFIDVCSGNLNMLFDNFPLKGTLR